MLQTGPHCGPAAESRHSQGLPGVPFREDPQTLPHFLNRMTQKVVSDLPAHHFPEQPMGEVGVIRVPPAVGHGRLAG